MAQPDIILDHNAEIPQRENVQTRRRIENVLIFRSSGLPRLDLVSHTIVPQIQKM